MGFFVDNTSIKLYEGSLSSSDVKEALELTSGSMKTWLAEGVGKVLCSSGRDELCEVGSRNRKHQHQTKVKMKNIRLFHNSLICYKLSRLYYKPFASTCPSKQLRLAQWLFTVKTEPEKVTANKLFGPV